MSRLYRSGFCGLGNPPESHARCVGSYAGTACACICHAEATIPEPLVVDMGSKARIGVFEGLPDDLYHSDPTSVSASGMKQILRSPAHYQHSLTHPQKSKALDLGTIAHHLVLGAGAKYAVLDPTVIGVKADGSVAASPTATAAWKEAVAVEEKAGKVVLTTVEYAAAERMADAVFTHRKAGPLFTMPGRSELSMFWRDPDHDVIRRCRWDRLTDTGIGLDLKTTRSSAPTVLPKTIVEYGYDLSADWYLAVAAGLGIEIAAYALVFVESTEPHAVVVTELSDEFLQRGAALSTKALATYRRCLDTGSWPAYADDDFLIVTPPRWSDTADQIALTIPEGIAA